MSEKKAEDSTPAGAETKKQEKKPQSSPKPRPQQDGSQSGVPPQKPTKSLTKAERREIQEQQRAAKAALKEGKPAPSPKLKPSTPSSAVTTPTTPAAEKTPAATTTSTTGSAASAPKSTEPQRSSSRLYSHLDAFIKQENKEPVPINSDNVHPAMIQLGFKYAEGIITGSNARCLALLNALKEVIMDYTTPANKVMSRDLDSKLKPNIDFIKSCRPMSISMGNALKHIKYKIHHLDSELPENEAKEQLIEDINTFIEERIIFTAQQIEKYGVERIRDGDVVLTYARSEVIERVLKKAHEDGKKFSVIVVDSRPKHEGLELLRRLATAGIKCSFILVNALSYVMRDVTKVMVGAHALFANGALMSRAGTACVTMIAKNFNVPVLVCCETYKFSERSQLDSITKNELADPDELVKVDRSDIQPRLSNWRQETNLTLLNLLYDVTPMEYIDMVITEVGLVPPTSISVILREKELANNE